MFEERLATSSVSQINYELLSHSDYEPLASGFVSLLPLKVTMVCTAETVLYFAPLPKHFISCDY